MSTSSNIDGLRVITYPIHATETPPPPSKGKLFISLVTPDNIGNNQPTILLADDDVDDQDLLKEAILEAQPTIRLLVFNNGREIIDFLEVDNRDSPCLIVLDYNMPIVNGVQVLEKIATNPRLRAVPTVIWSTSASPQHRQRCLDTGALRYIIKPNNSGAFNQVAREMVSICCRPIHTGK